MDSYSVLIPLRGGSKSIPLKNIKPIGGRPLFYWVAAAACQASSVRRVYVSTDSPRIAEEVRTWFGEQVTVIDRPAELAQDQSSTECVVEHFLRVTGEERVILMQATSPLTTAHDLDQAVSLFERKGFDSLLTAVRTKRFFWTDAGAPLNYDPNNRPRRQDFAGLLMENGAFYIFRRDGFEKSGSRLHGTIGVYEMSEETAVEIDEPSDWEAVERLLRKAQFAPRIDLVKLLVLDVDGTLTDGGMYYSGTGECMKKFNTRDAAGIARLRRAGMRVAIMTGERSPSTRARVEKIGVDFCYEGVQNKRECLLALCQEQGLKLSEIAFVGDDYNDLACLEMVGFSACPADAVPEAKAASQYVCANRAGEGAVREVCDLLYSPQRGQ